MSYIRPLENRSGIYIYPDIDGYIQFCGIPQNADAKIPDDLLDILLAKMNNKEIIQRQEHGAMLLNLLDKEDYESYHKNKKFNF